MIQKNALYFILLLVFNSLACSKEKTTTSITGIITDDATGFPMNHIATWIIADDYETQKSYSDTCFTDSQGQYSLSVTGSSINEINMYVYKYGYVFLNYPILAGSTIVKNIALPPYDSYIKFKIYNKLNKGDGVYGWYWGKGDSQSISYYYNPIPIPMGTAYTEIREIPGNTYIHVAWDYFFFPIYYKYPNLDSIYVSRGDTVIYNITM